MSSLKIWRASLALALAGGAVIGAPPVQAGNYLYGVSVSNQLYSINLETRKERQLALSVDPGDKLANGVAVDPSRFNLFVMDGNNNLRIWRDGTDTLDIAATPEQLGLEDNGFTNDNTNAQSAAFFDDAYWFFPRNSNVLNRVNLDENGKFISRFAYQFQGVPDGEGNQLFGDIAINPLDGRLYAATTILNNKDITRSTGNFYSLDLAKLPAEDSRFERKDPRYTSICSKCVPGNLQLGYDASKKVLYGVSNITDQWYAVNTALAINTNPAKPVSGWSASVDFFDLSDVALTREISTGSPLPVPGHLPLLGAAAAFGWSRKLRRRIASCHTRTSSRLADRVQSLNLPAAEPPQPLKIPASEHPKLLTISLALDSHR